MPKAEKTAAGSYRIRYTDPLGRRQVITRPTAADARAAYNRALGDISRGEWVDPRRARATLAEWADEWLAGARHLGPGGHDTYRDALDRYILPELGRARLGKLNAVTVDQFLTRLLTEPRERTGRPLAPATVHQAYRALHTMLAVAVARGLIARNPCELVDAPKVAKRERIVYTVEQVDALAQALTRSVKRVRSGPLESRYRAWVYVAAYGGLRWSELCGLRRRHVDGARVRVVEQLVRRKGGWDRCEPKAGSLRTVTLPAFAAAELAAHLEQFSLSGDDGLVFPTRGGNPMQAPSWTANTYHPAQDRAGLPRVRPHDLRHTSVSLALDAGARLELVQARHGHSSIGVTADVYGHRYAGADEAVAGLLDDLRARKLRGHLRAI